MEAIELRAARLANRFICSSPADEKMTRRWDCHDRVRTVPNGVDTDLYSFGIAPKATKPLLVFLGNFNYFPNTDAIKHFVLDILPEIRSRIPDIRLKIVGYQADVKLTRLRANPGIEIQGYKPDVRADLARAWVSICPLRSGSGSRIKILESMAVGTAVISTPVGCRGLPVQHGENVLIATSANMAKTIVEVVNNQGLRDRIASNARVLVENQMTWKHSLACLEEVYSEVSQYARWTA